MNSMKCIISTAVLLALGLGVAMSAPRSEDTRQAAGSRGKEGQLRTVSMKVGSKDIRAVVADTMPSRQEGLLRWESISDDEGMLLDFVFPDKLAIHMQGMKFPIDAVWMDAQGVIQVIYENIAPNSGQVYPSMIACRYCLELKGGFCKKYGVKTGRKVQFDVR
jgi:uncharacterized protein